MINGNRNLYGANDGGGVYIAGSSSIGYITHTTITANYSVDQGGGFFCNGCSSSSYIKNSIIYGNTAATTTVYKQISGTLATTQVTYSDINQTGYAPNNGNIDLNPSFTSDYHIPSNSDCIDEGIDLGELDDIDNTGTRPYDMPKPDSPSAYDMGADEYSQ